MKSGNPRPFDDRHGALITSYHFANSHKEEIRSIPWDLAAIDEAHKLRNCYRESNRIGQGIRWALEERKKLLLTATPLQNSLLEPYGLSTLIDENIFGHPAPMQRSFRAHFHYLSMNRGCTPGWYAPPPWGANHASLPQGGIHIPAQGATLGIGIPTNPRSEGTPHTSAPATHPNAALLQSTYPSPIPNPGLHPGLVCHAPLGQIISNAFVKLTRHAAIPFQHSPASDFQHQGSPSLA